MSDTLRRYRAIRRSLTQCSPDAPTGPVARPVNTLAALICGIVASKSTQWPKVASTVPDGNLPESRVKRFARWSSNDVITEEGYFLPYAEVLLAHGALPTLVLVMDGSAVGRGGIALMMPVVYKGRALPIAWLVRQGKKGHFPAALHMAFVEQVQEMIPPGASVVLLGEGAFDGISLQQTIAEGGWDYVCRTGINMTATWQGETFRLDPIETCIQPGTRVELSEVLFTADAYGPIMLLCGWATGDKAPLYWVTHLTKAEAACRL